MPGSKPHGEKPDEAKQPWGQPTGLMRDDVGLRPWVKAYRTEIAASASGVLSTCAAYPLDTVKTRMQAYHFHRFTDCVRHTYQTEGARGFMRGSAGPLLSTTFVRTLSLSIYQKTKHVYADWLQKITGTSPLVTNNPPGRFPTLDTVACFGAAGATAGAVLTCIACPFELTKVSAQTSVLMARRDSSGVDDSIRQSYEKKGTFRTAANIVRHRGVLGLYSGVRYHLARDVLGTAIYFMTYETGKQVASSTINPSAAPLAVVLAGGVCGIMSFACIYPIDTAKTIYQRDCLMHHRDKPIEKPKIQWFSRQLYRGLGVSMCRSFVVNAVFFSAFEFVKGRINTLDG